MDYGFDRDKLENKPYSGQCTIYIRDESATHGTEQHVGYKKYCEYFREFQNFRRENEISLGFQTVSCLQNYRSDYNVYA